MCAICCAIGGALPLPMRATLTGTCRRCEVRFVSVTRMPRGYEARFAQATEASRCPSCRAVQARHRVGTARARSASRRSNRSGGEASAVRMSGRWVRRGLTVILFGVDRDGGSGSDRAVVRELPLEVTGTIPPCCGRAPQAWPSWICRRALPRSASLPARPTELRIADRRSRQSLPAVARARR